MIVVDNAVVYHGSNLDVLPTLPDNSVDSIVTDPPYELGFMGKKWDSSGIAYSVELWTECLRVLKPGGHLLAFGGSRTWHRMAVAIEDAGFEMRDSIAWLYGSGFPKSMDISKQIDKQAGAEREIVGRNPNSRENAGKENSLYEPGTVGKTAFQTVAATDEAKQWQGWGTALKPAFEPVVVARKPLEEKTVAANVLKYGTGGLNIDGSRIGSQGDGTQCSKRDSNGNCLGHEEANGSLGGGVMRHSENTVNGRWPANIILDPFTAELLDEQSGVSKPKPERQGPRGGKLVHDGGWDKSAIGVWPADLGGGASRFFYVAKANKKDRNEGLDALQETSAGEMVERKEGSAGMNSPRAGAGRTSGAKNFHPTVKPTALMEYLIKLVTPSGGTVLDPFTGSGSTGKAALLNGFQFIGIELTEDYLPIIEGRLTWANAQAQQLNNQNEEKLF